MFWVKDTEGQWVNLAVARSITCNTRGFVIAVFDSENGAELCKGEFNDCLRFRDNLIAQLKENQRGVYEF